MAKRITNLLLIIVIILSGVLIYKKFGTERVLTMPHVIDLTHKFTASMPVHSYDEPASITKIRNLEDDKYNDWRLCSGMHVGTHIDGPGHLTDSPMVLADVPVEKFVGTGCLIDARNKPIDVELLQEAQLNENSIVLIWTGFDKKFGTEEYFTKHPVLTPAFARELARHRVKMVGLDFFSPDHYPFEIHKLLFEHNILIIENLTNLDSLVGVSKFTVVALPLKTETDSALARVVAIED
jgi:kynurenine formamidase